MKLLAATLCLTTIDVPIWALVLSAFSLAFVGRVLWLAKKENFVYMRDRHSGAILYETV